MIKISHSTWDPQWTPTEHEIFRDFEYAAFTAQMLESELITILLAAEYAGHIQFKKKNDIESELFLSKKPLGTLIGELKRCGFDENITEILNDALDARNYLMHNFFVWNAPIYPTENGRGQMLKELQELRFRIGKVQVIFSQIREQIVEQTYGLTKTEIEKLLEEHKQRLQKGEQGT